MITTINDAIEKRRKALQDGENEKGFTLIELMVVIIIIGILAAIAIPAFLGQRQAAWDASVKSDLANLEIAATAYSVNNNGSYALMSESILAAAPYNFQQSSGNTVPIVTLVGTTGYTVSEYNTNSGATGHTFTFSSATGLTTTS